MVLWNYSKRKGKHGLETMATHAWPRPVVRLSFPAIPGVLAIPAFHTLSHPPPPYFILTGMGEGGGYVKVTA
jgi:hypothetical protein